MAPISDSKDDLYKFPFQLKNYNYERRNYIPLDSTVPFLKNALYYTNILDFFLYLNFK